MVTETVVTEPNGQNTDSEAEAIKKLQEIVKEECKKVMSDTYVFSEDIGGFSKEDLLKDMYIEPQSDVSVDCLLHSYIIQNPSKKILVQADGGVGKSTLLAKVYKELAEKFRMEGSSNACPLYYDLKGQPLNSITLKRMILLQENSEGIVLSNFNCCEYVILIDGLDEIKNTGTHHIDEFFKSDFFTDCKTIIACRKVFIRENALNKRFDEIITLSDYRANPKKQFEMLENFCKYTKTKGREISDEKKDKIKKYIEKNSMSLQNPLILSFFLLNMKEGDIPKENLNAGGILDNCIKSIIERECSKYRKEKEEASKLITTILQKISKASWRIYLNRAGKGDLNFDDIVEKSVMQDSELINKCINLFLSRVGEINEVILDYFCAKYMFYVFIGEINDELDLFSVDHIKVEIKRFAFNDFMVKKHKKKAFKYLKKKYKQLNEDEYVKYLSLVNFFPHIKKENNIKLKWFLLCEYFKVKNKDIYDARKNTIYHCILQTGYMPWLESEYYKRMVDDPKFDSFVRGGYLLYYDKSLIKDFKHPYLDEKRSDTKFSDWNRVFSEGFKNHIEEDKGKKGKHKKRRYVRRIEFRAAKQFIEERKEVAPEIAEFYKNLGRDDYSFNEAVEKEYNSLKETIKKYENVSVSKN